ncbi:MAG: hypothetical protein HFH47_02780 [Bacilli bacterium]|nr:hypothetical protein [Bacilli bacterium]
MKKIINLTITMIIVFLAIYFNPCQVYAAPTADSGGGSTTSGTTMDGIMQGADGFITAGKNAPIDDSKLKGTSDFIYNALLAIAMVVAVIVGMIIGIKFMMAGIEEKAKIKESLVPYVAGCVVVFGAFGIWKLAILVLSAW